MKRESVIHDGINLCFGGALHQIDFRKLVGKGVTIYGQQEVVKDLIARARRWRTDPVRGRDVSVGEIDGQAPKIRFRHGGASQEIDCDFIGGCDGFHGVCRPEHSGEIAQHLRARISVRLARHPGGGAAGRG